MPVTKWYEFCNKNTPETIEHMLIECFRWNSMRHETTIFNIPQLNRTVTIDQSTNNQALNQGRNIMVGKLLGGESKETRSLLAQSRDRYSPYTNGIRVVRTLILDRIKSPTSSYKQAEPEKSKTEVINTQTADASVYKTPGTSFTVTRSKFKQTGRYSSQCTNPSVKLTHLEKKNDDNKQA
ncbi:hypothetical protein BB560_005986, partial [Smittium megazygosporum]